MDRYGVLAASITALKGCDDAWQRLLSVYEEKVRGYVTVNNAHTVVEATRDETYRKIIEDSELALPDGQPLVWVGRARGYPVQRVFGPSFLEFSLKASEGTSIRHYFFGSRPEILEKMKKTIQTRYPGVKTAGFHSPPFRDFSDQDNRDYLQAMNRSGADLYWIALGAPRQERWMAAHIHGLNKGMMIGIGAGFDYLAGQTRHAPRWMKRCSLEWLARLIQEPARLWKRYLIINSLFVYYLLLELIHVKRFDTGKV